MIAIAEGRYLDAYRLFRASNPFPSLCSRACASPCEAACTRGNIDGALSIRALEHFVCEFYGVESVNGKSIWAEPARRPTSPRERKIVGVIGTGLGTLACAHDLAAAGYECVVFEADQAPGLPSDEVARLEIDAVLAAVGGVRPCEASPADLLRDGFSAVVAERREPEASEQSGVVQIDGGQTLIHEIAAGKRAAEDVRRRLSGPATPPGTVWGLFPVAGGLNTLVFEPQGRQEPLRLSLPEGPDGLLREFPFDEETARRQGSRCLQCSIHPALDAELCTMCGLCVDLCPTQVLRLQPTEESAEHRVGLLIDASRCIRCGVCMQACPPRAMTMTALEQEPPRPGGPG